MDLMDGGSSLGAGSSECRAERVRWSSLIAYFSFPSLFYPNLPLSNRPSSHPFITYLPLLVSRTLRLNILDLLTMAAMGAIGLGVYEADPAPRRHFPVTVPGSTGVTGTGAALGEAVYPQ